MYRPMPRKNLLLTGRPGVGKTTVVRKIIEQLGAQAGGFFTEEMREGRQRVGFKILTTDGREGILAHVSLPSPHRVGKYGVNVEGIDEVAVPALLKALQAAPLIVIDEIAKMELCSQDFKDAVVKCLDSPKPLLAVIQMSSLPFLNQIRARADVEVIEVTPSDRDALPRQLAERLRGWLLPNT